MLLGDDTHLTPIPVEEEVSSLSAILSAILLDADYYGFLYAHKIEIDGIPLVREQCLIPLKAKAWLDLKARKDAGESVDSKSIWKHRSDILRLYQLFLPAMRVELPEAIKKDLTLFLKELGSDEAVDLKALGIRGVSVPDIVQRLRAAYGID